MDDIKLIVAALCSLPLRNFLYKNGLKYKLAALNPNSKNHFGFI